MINFLATKRLLVIVTAMMILQMDIMVATLIAARGREGIVMATLLSWVVVRLLLLPQVVVRLHMVAHAS
jgi:hypothetical protein